MGGDIGGTLLTILLAKWFHENLKFCISLIDFAQYITSKLLFFFVACRYFQKVDDGAYT